MPADFMFLFDLRHTCLTLHYLRVFRGLMKRIQRITILTTPLVLAISCFAQTGAEKKSYTFHGLVQVVDESAKSMKVNGEEVKGWMAWITNWTMPQYLRK